MFGYYYNLCSVFIIVNDDCNNKTIVISCTGTKLSGHGVYECISIYRSDAEETSPRFPPLGR